jgi:polyisoprenoid-binding protein YceI
MNRNKLWLLAIPVGLVVLVVGGTWFYFNVISDDAPPPLELSGGDTSATTQPGSAVEPGSLTGTWRPTSGSQVGYRVDEVAFGQSQTAAGRTDAVTGELVLDSTEVTAASFTADMTKITSGENRRDNQFRGRIMDVATHPQATFKLTSPINFGSVPAAGQPETYQAAGELTLRGTTKPVTFPVDAVRNGANIEVKGTIPIVFEEWAIPNPSFGPVSTEDNGVLEFLLVFAKT